VPPSMLATALLPQTYDRVSDDEAIARSTYDIYVLERSMRL